MAIYIPSLQQLHQSKMQNKIAIIGGGELAQKLMDQLSGQAELIDVRYRRKQGFILADPQLAKEQLLYATIVVNLLLTGQDFLNIGIIKILPPETIIVDFGRPSISIEITSHRIIEANRLVHPSIHFWPSLPGGWQSNELPACSLPCILASFGDSSEIKNIRDFSIIAKFLKFRTVTLKGDNYA